MASLESAQALLDELIQQAKTGAIIPVRLPGQLEAIQDALRAIKEAPAEPAPAAERGEDGEPLDPVAEAMADQAKFNSHAIHELRTPMTSIRGYSDMMSSMGELNEMQKQFVETIRINARRMESLLTDVSDMSKIRGGTLRYTLKMDMFKNIAMMVEKQVHPVVESLERTITFDIPQGLPLLNTDGELLAKAISKLVENALRYCEESCSVTVSAHAEGNDLVIAIKDTGIGMTADEIAQLGTVYYRSENEVVRTYKGSGLGIPIAYGIIKALGGKISVTSASGEGTTFTITLAGMS